MGKRKERKFYVVWKGHEPGIYDNWPDAFRQVSGYAGATHKSFPSKEEAEAAFREEAPRSGTRRPTPARMGRGGEAGIELDSIAVDAACSGNPGAMEYQGVRVRSGERLFHVGPLEEGTNNIGEFLAVVHALALLKKESKPHVPVYSDSRTAQSWVRRKTCRTKLGRTPRNERIFELIQRAEKWLRENAVTNPILKWETKAWGEIPADFGRK